MIHPALRTRVRSIEVVASSGGLDVLPSSGAVLGVQRFGRIRHGGRLLSTAGVTGIQENARSYEYVGETTSILVRFTPQGATCLAPSSELARSQVSLEDLLGRERVRVLEDRLADGADGVALVQALLLELPFHEDPVIDHAVERLETDAVAAVARAVGLSERQLERRFLARVGLTPKRFASIRRFERAMSALGSRRPLTEVALEVGYYDQAHFVREIRRLAGVTPGALRRRMSESYNRAPPGGGTMRG